MNAEELADVIVSMSPMLANRHSQALRPVAHRFDTDDLIQATSMRAHVALPKFRGTTEGELRAWLLSIASSVCNSALVTHSKTQKRSTQSEDHSVVQGDGDFSQDDADDPLIQQAIREQCHRMHQCLDRLPRQRQDVLKMRFLEGRNYPEIASKLGVSIEAARSSVSQALRAVRVEMDQPCLPGFE